MKNSILLLSFLFLFCSIDLKSQKILSDNLTVDSTYLAKLQKKYATVIICNKRGYWQPNSRPYILIKKKHHWEIIYWTTKLVQEGFIKNQYAFKKRKSLVKSQSVLSMLTFLNKPQFWALQNEYLNDNQKKSQDSSSVIIMIDDCSTDCIEVFQNGRHKKYTSYCPDFYQGIIPNPHRGYFINCRNVLTDFITKMLKKEGV